ncbi:MAG: hypothetical protein IJ758_02845 [Clostridia bacterium]|nr:hypothetical protein [Clostridia bacterium]
MSKYKKGEADLIASTPVETQELSDNALKNASGGVILRKNLENGWYGFTLKNEKTGEKLGGGTSKSEEPGILRNLARINGVSEDVIDV